jgi:catechol 2,3-dioxygenase-like lactoylglutathione lyase family enzyme
LFSLFNLKAITQEHAVQSVMLRSVIVTHKLHDSIYFYRDILGQKIIERRVLDTTRSQTFIATSSDAVITHIILEGSGEFPGDPIIGGRMSLIGVDDPNSEFNESSAHPARHGDVIFSHRVSNLDEIYQRIQAKELEVLYPPRISSTGRSRTMMVYDPNGKIIELYELFNTQ